MRSYLLAVLFITTAVAATQPAAFDAPKAFPLPQESGPAVLGDFNGDGILDIAAPSTIGSSYLITVYLGNREGTFQSSVSSIIPGPPGGGIAVADFDGDGKLDLAIAYCVPNSNCAEGGGIAVLLGNGDGTFQSAKVFVSGNAPPTYMAVADFNGDGKPDLAALVNVDDTGAFPVTLLGTGDGTFDPPVKVNLNYKPSYSYPLMAIGDVNGDGKPDLVFAVVPDFGASPQGGIFVTLGNGDGTFQPQVGVPFARPTSVALGDFNNDGILDLAVGGPHNVAILLGNGDGSFQTPQTFPAQGTVAAVADLNGDGNLDVAILGYSTAYILLGDGHGALGKEANYLVGALTYQLLVGDINGDGVLDLAAQTYLDLNIGFFYEEGSAMAILLGDGGGHFEHVRLSSPSGTSISPNAIAVADFNGDGKLDVAATGPDFPDFHNGDFAVWLGKGDGTFTPLSNGYGLLGNAIAAGDFNGDGKQDLVIITNAVNILLGNGDGTFQNPVAYTLPSPGATVAVADLNGDGNLDLVVTPVTTGSTVPRVVFVLLGKGQGVFGSAKSVPVGNAPNSVAVADFNGDGKPDLAVVVTPTGEPGAVAILLGNGDGTFQPATTHAAGQHPMFVAAADFNLDGKIDLAVANVSAGSPAGGPTDVVILLGKGDGTFGGPVRFPAGAGAALSLVVADFNGDGRPDIAVAGSALSIMLGRGEGTFEPPQGFSPQLLGNVAVGDFNGDGKPDLVQGPLDTTFAILLNITP